MNKKLQNFVQKVPGWLSMSEAKFLEQVVQQTEHLNGEIVEIGSFCGKSTICLAQSNGKVFAIDPHKGKVEEGKEYEPSYRKFVKNMKLAKVTHKVIPIVKTSEKAATDWKKRIRALFIDGLHDEENATNDFKLWSRHLVNGGIIAIHDSFCRWCGSEKVALRHVVLSPDFYKIGVVGSIIYGVKGRATTLQKFVKLFQSAYILTAIHVNHFRIVLTNTAIIRNKFFPATAVSASN